MNVHDRLTKLRAKSPKITPEPTPTTGPVVDLEAQAIADRLMAQFSRKTNGEPTAPVAESAKQTELPNTMSLDPQRFEDLKNLKAAQAALAVAEKKIAALEKSLEVVTVNLSDLFMTQNKRLDNETRSWLSNWQIEHVHGVLKIYTHPSQVASVLFSVYPQISDVALLNLSLDAATIEDWRKWYRGYKEHDHEYWLNLLADVQAGKLKAAEGQPELLTELLRAEGVKVDDELKQIKDERLRRFEYEHPIIVSPRSGTYTR